MEKKKEEKFPRYIIEENENGFIKLVTAAFLLLEDRSVCFYYRIIAWTTTRRNFFLSRKTLLRAFFMRFPRPPVYRGGEMIFRANVRDSDSFIQECV